MAKLLHPIRVAAQRSGLTPEIMRAWETRYGVVSPTRGDAGRRLYSDADIERFTLLRQACLGGRAIGEVAHRPDAELRALVAADRAARPGVLGLPPVEAMVAEAYEAVRKSDPLRVEAVLRLAAMQLPLAELVDTMIVPFMRAVGEGWHGGSLTVAQEHLATALVRAVVASLTRTAGLPPDAPQIIVAAPSGERHEIGALAVAAAAAADGWRVLYLGADTPVADVAALAHTSRAACIALSITVADDRAGLLRSLRSLRAALPLTRIIAGGQAAARLARELGEMRVELMPDTRVLVPSLRELRLGA